jgi:hypothetical protein
MVRTGKKTTLKDIHNLISRIKRDKRGGATAEERTESVLRELCENKDAAACIYTDSERVAQTLTFQTPQMRRLFAAFPEVVMIDSTHATNSRRYKLFSFLVQDLDGKVRNVHAVCRRLYVHLTFQYAQHALMTSESKSNMIDTVRSFKINNPAWRSIRVIVTDKDFTERAVLSAAFPDARMLLCQFHVVRYLTKQVNALYVGALEEKDALINTMSALMYSESKIEYDRNKRLLLRQLEDDHEHQLYDYFIRNWDGITEEWVSYARTSIPHLGNHTNNRYVIAIW